MKNESKHIVDAYTSVNAPKVDLELRIKENIDRGRVKNAFNMRSALVACLILLVTSTVVFAISRIIIEEDGARSLITEENKKWSINTKSGSTITAKEYARWSEMFDEMDKIEPHDDKAILGYYKYNEEEPGHFTYRSHIETYYKYKNDSFDEMLKLELAPAYLPELMDVLNGYIGIDAAHFCYGIDDQSVEAFQEYLFEVAPLGEPYAEQVSIDKVFGTLYFNAWSKHPDKLFNIDVKIAEVWNSSTGSSHEVEYETIMINGREAMLSKKADGKHHLVAEANGVGVLLSADTMGDPQNLIDFAKDLLDVIEKY